MPLSIFQPPTLSHFQEAVGKADRFEHTFGGDPATHGIRFVNCEPMHLIYRLNQADPAVQVTVPGLNWLPLCYHFSFASLDGDLIYRVLNDFEIELLSPTDAEYDPDFPYPNFPRQFPASPVAFRKAKYDPAVAEDALQLAAVFGVEHLSPAEMQRATVIADETCKTISDWGSGGGVPGKHFPDWSPEELVRFVHRQPFFQGAPTKSCKYPECTAEIEYRTEAKIIQRYENFIEATGEPLIIPGHVVRRSSLRVFAIYQPDDDNRVWPHVQLVFQVCECCHCICVTNQCD